MIDLYVDRKKPTLWDQEVGDYFSKDSSKFYRKIATLDGQWDTKSEQKLYVSSNQRVIEQNDKYGLEVKDRFDSHKIAVGESKFDHILEAIGLDLVECFLHNQKPGQMTLLHLDGLRVEGKLDHLTQEQKEKDYVKLFVFLEDWAPGQIMLMGSDHFAKWRRGDVVWFDWPNLPHGTANFGVTERPMLFLVGKRTAKFDSIFNSKENVSLQV
jgi:hypothetical protein